MQRFHDRGEVSKKVFEVEFCIALVRGVSMQGEKDDWLSIKVIVNGDITNMGILHRDDLGVRILLQFKSSAFGDESRNTSFTIFFGLDENV